MISLQFAFIKLFLDPNDIVTWHTIPGNIKFLVFVVLVGSVKQMSLSHVINTQLTRVDVHYIEMQIEVQNSAIAFNAVLITILESTADSSFKPDT